MTGAPAFSIREVAAMVGIAAHTIRAWERRYGVVTPQRTTGNQRRYSSEDVQTLIRIKQSVTARGLSLRLAAFELNEGSLRDTIPEAAGVASPKADGYHPDDWRSAADVLPQLIVVLDMQGRLVDANVAVARAANTVRSRLRGFRFADMVDPHDRAKAARLYLSPVGERRDWALNIRLAGLAGLFSFDCRLVHTDDAPLIVAVGREVPDDGPS
jgi:PAS domain-containing protein